MGRTMNKFSVLACAPAFLLLTDGQAQAQEISGSVTLVSDYIFRAVSQTSEDPAVQVDINAAWENGVYVGAWSSNIDFGPGDDTHLEVDLYAGWAGSAAGLDVDVLAAVYTYPGSDIPDQEYLELSAGAAKTINNITLDVRAYYAPEYYGDSGASYYVETGAAVALTDAIAVDVRAGHSTFDELDNADYSDFQAGISYAHGAFTVGLRHHWATENIDSASVVSVSRAF